MHDWLPTGHKQAQVDVKVSYCCPCCGTINETQQHILQCQDYWMHETRYKSLVSMPRSDVVTKKGTSYTWIALHRCLEYWSNNNNNPLEDQILQGVQKHPTRQHIAKAIQEQSMIGWQYAFWGYLTSQWALCQQTEHPRSTLQGIKQINAPRY